MNHVQLYAAILSNTEYYRVISSNTEEIYGVLDFIDSVYIQNSSFPYEIALSMCPGKVTCECIE